MTCSKACRSECRASQLQELDSVAGHGPGCTASSRAPCAAGISALQHFWSMAVGVTSASAHRLSPPSCRSQGGPPSAKRPRAPPQRGTHGQSNAAQAADWSDDELDGDGAQPGRPAPKQQRMAGQAAQQEEVRV